MKDIRSDAFRKMYEDSIKIEDAFDYFALVTTYEDGNFVDREIRVGDKSLTEIIENKLDNMVKIIPYSRPLGLIDDIVFHGSPVNVGNPIYFGEFMNDALVLDCGVVLTDYEDNADTYHNYLVSSKSL